MHLRPETFVAPLIEALVEEDDDWIDAYWVLFDCLWAVEIAITQRYVDLGQQTALESSSQHELNLDEMLEQLFHARTSLITTVFHVTGPMSPDPILLESLALGLFNWDDDLDQFLSRQDDNLVCRIMYMKS